MRRRDFLLLCAFFGGSQNGTAVADSLSFDPLLRLFQRFGRKYRLPENLLYAIAKTESGRRVEGVVRPWPWTVGLNAGGVLDGHFFETSTAAVRYARSLSMRNFDVGICQVSNLYHRKRFASLEAMIEPSNNIEFAARLLRENYEATKSWILAIARYHAGERAAKRFPDRYVQRVLTYWKAT